MSTRRELARVAAAVEALGDAPTPRNTAHTTRGEKLPWMARLILWWGSSERKDADAIRDRRSFPITAFVGPNGGGKTLSMIATSKPTRDGIWWECENPDHAHTKNGQTAGWRRMLSTVPILDGDGQLHPLYDRFDDFQQLVDVEHSDVYMDEVTSVASSRESQRMDARVLNKLVQLRKADVMLFWTAPNWARADKVMREVTQAVVECRGYYPLRSSSEATATTIWQPKRVFLWRTYDALEFEEWSASKRDDMRPLSKQWFRGPGSEAFTAYDTLGSVSIVASITPENTCTVCEGTVVRPRCTCKRAPRPLPMPVVEIGNETGSPADGEPTSPRHLVAFDAGDLGAPPVEVLTDAAV